ncbi:unnamed protein product [Diplocarpon coronariae]
MRVDESSVRLTKLSHARRRRLRADGEAECASTSFRPTSAPRPFAPHRLTEPSLGGAGLVRVRLTSLGVESCRVVTVPRRRMGEISIAFPLARTLPPKHRFRNQSFDGRGPTCGHGAAPLDVDAPRRIAPPDPSHNWRARAWGAALVESMRRTASVAAIGFQELEFGRLADLSGLRGPRIFSLEGRRASSDSEYVRSSGLEARAWKLVATVPVRGRGLTRPAPGGRIEPRKRLVATAGPAVHEPKVEANHSRRRHQITVKRTRNSASTGLGSVQSQMRMSVPRPGSSDPSYASCEDNGQSSLEDTCVRSKSNPSRLGSRAMSGELSTRRQRLHQIAGMTLEGCSWLEGEVVWYKPVRGAVGIPSMAVRRLGPREKNSRSQKSFPKYRVLPRETPTDGELPHPEGFQLNACSRRAAIQPSPVQFMRLFRGAKCPVEKPEDVRGDDLAGSRDDEGSSELCGETDSTDGRQRGGPSIRHGTASPTWEWGRPFPACFVRREGAGSASTQGCEATRSTNGSTAADSDPFEFLAAGWRWTPQSRSLCLELGAWSGRPEKRRVPSHRSPGQPRPTAAPSLRRDVRYAVVNNNPALLVDVQLAPFARGHHYHRRVLPPPAGPGT